jgi:Extensin-like protein C-terminus
MTPGVRKSLVGSAVLATLIAAAGCSSHYLMADRDAWRHEAEESCINSGVPEETPGRVRISTISGPGACGIDYPLKVSELGLSTPLGYDDEPLQPPGSIPNASMPQHWPVVQSQPLPPPEAAPPQDDEGPNEAVDDGPPPYDAAPYGAPPSSPPQYGAQPYGQPQYGSQPYSQPQYGAPPAYGQPAYNTPQYGASPYGQPTANPSAGAPMSLSPPGLAPPDDDDAEESGPVPNNGAANAAPVDIPPSLYSPRPMMAPPGRQQTVPAAREEPIPPLGPPAAPVVPASAGPVQLKPAATLACPLVSALDKWVSASVQPAAFKWFRQPVVEIKQIGSYSCRAMVNGNPNAPISEHAFGNALDIAEFDLADGHKISVQYGWHGTPEEQGFLRDVQGAACQNFTTVLAPGANVYHYNHIHVDLMRRRGRPYICEPSAIPGDVVAARARAHYAAQHYGAGITGSIKKSTAAPLGYSADDDDRLPLAVPGED